MKLKNFIALPVAIATLALSASGAYAQVVGPRVALQFATNGLTNPLVASSEDAVIARLLLDTTGSTEAVRISGLPFNLVVANGAMPSTLNNCRVFNETNMSDALSSSNSSTSLVSGMNNIAFNQALILPANSLTTLALSCDVDSTLVAGGTYLVNMNTNNVVATGASTGLQAAVTIRGSVVVPPVVIPPTTTPTFPVTGAAGEAAEMAAMLVASVLIASLGYSYLSLKRN